MSKAALVVLVLGLALLCTIAKADDTISYPNYDFVNGELVPRSDPADHDDFLIEDPAELAEVLPVAPNANAVDETSPLASGTIISISVKQITDALTSGGTDPVSKLILNKVLAQLNAVGITIRSGAIVFEGSYGEIGLKGGCSPVKLLGGWSVKAVVKPATSYKMRLALTGSTLHLIQKIHMDTSFGCSGSVRFKKGKKIFRKCVRIFRKTQSFRVSGDLVMDMTFDLGVTPKMVKSGNDYDITVVPKIRVGGRLISFKPKSNVTIKIFGIKIGFITKAVNKAIEKAMRNAVSPSKLAAELRKLQAALQSKYNAEAAKIRWRIPGLASPSNANALRSVQSAVSVIKTKQSRF